MATENVRVDGPDSVGVTLSSLRSSRNAFDFVIVQNIWDMMREICLEKDALVNAGTQNLQAAYVSHAVRVRERK